PSPPPRARLGFRCSDPVLATLPRRPQPAWRRRQGRKLLPSNRKHERAQRASGRRRPTWRTDTGSGLTGILLTQRMATSPVPTENNLRAVEGYWVAMRSGLYITAVNWHRKPDEIAYIVNDSGATALIVSAGQAPAAEAITGLTTGVKLRLAFGGQVKGYGSY